MLLPFGLIFSTEPINFLNIVSFSFHCASLYYLRTVHTIISLYGHDVIKLLKHRPLCFVRSSVWQFEISNKVTLCSIAEPSISSHVLTFYSGMLGYNLHDTTHMYSDVILIFVSNNRRPCT